MIQQLGVFASFLVLGMSASADQYICHTPSNDLRIVVSYSGSPDDVTSILLSNETRVSAETRPIASFIPSQVTSEVNENGLSYEMKVDLRLRGNQDSGEDVMGTDLGLVNTLTLSIDDANAESESRTNQSNLMASIKAEKRNGTEIPAVALTCDYYAYTTQGNDPI